MRAHSPFSRVGETLFSCAATPPRLLHTRNTPRGDRVYGAEHVHERDDRRSAGRVRRGRGRSRGRGRGRGGSRIL